jgi:2-polyprenyl-3-methyl-5-hydroxy-6-metoxy-1,4-benzoquinol methylase
MGKTISVKEFFECRDPLESSISSEKYQELTTIILSDKIADELVNFPDPFSNEYKSKALELYYRIRGSVKKYDPECDELSNNGKFDNVFIQTSPWSFKDSKFVSEMFYSWGHIFERMNVLPGETISVLEYGSGSGQLSLFLARLGCEVHAVDIDDASLKSIDEQAKIMGLDVKTEKGLFGAGFAGKKFDRIIFFEAFHHSIDFVDLLTMLKGRLNPGGFVVFAGEPIYATPEGAVPFAWGPRLDGLSARCMRDNGWMELGFTREFFTKLLYHTGWIGSFHPYLRCGRAEVYIARPMTRAEAAGDTQIDFGDPSPATIFSPQDWGEPEVTHRWTIADIAGFTIPASPSNRLDVSATIGNYLPVEKEVTFRCGALSVVRRITPGAVVELNLSGAEEAMVSISTSLHRPTDISESSDLRPLGVAVSKVTTKRAGRRRAARARAQ